MNSIFDTLVNIRELQMFCTTIQIVRTTKILHTAGPFTVFAPTDRAFMQLSSLKWQQLTANIPLLTKIVTNHIVAGDFTYHNLLKMCKKNESKITLTSIEGLPLHVDLTDGIRIGKSTVISTDILAENGIVHPIDRLILPQMPDLPQKNGWMSAYSVR